MSRPSLHLVSSQDRAGRGQIDSSKAFGRGHVADAVATRAELPARWQALMGHLFGHGPGGRAETAVAFACTLQTACNWHDGVVAPSGYAVAHAWAMWPQDCARFLCGGARLRRVA